MSEPVRTPGPPPDGVEQPGQIRWERTPRGCGPIGCMYVAVGLFIVLLIAVLYVAIMQPFATPELVAPTP